MDKKFVSPWLVLLALMVFYIVVCLPISQAGFYSDDAPNSLIASGLMLSHKSVWSFCKEINLSNFSDGRLFPADIYIRYPFHMLFPSQATYQWMRIIFIWISVLSAAWLVQAITRNLKATLFFLFALPLFWTIRAYHDPLTSFDTRLAQVLFGSCLMLVGYFKFKETKNYFWTFLALISYAFALLTYEIGIIGLVPLVLIAWIDKKSFFEFLKSIFPYVIVTFMYLGAISFLRHHSTAVYSGISFGPLSLFPKTFLKQFIAGIPMTYWALSFRPMFSPAFFHFSLLPNLLNLAIVGFISYHAFRHLIGQLSFNQKQGAYLLIIGLCFVLIPSILMGFSKRYQLEIPWGMGYLPVYLQYPGMCFLLMVGVSQIKSERWQRYSVILLTFLTIFTLATNFSTVRDENNEWQRPRELVAAALQNGLFSNLPPHTIIVRKKEGPDAWHDPAFYWQYSGKKLDILTINNHSQFHTRDLSSQENFLLVDDIVENTNQGYVLLSKIHQLHYGKVYGKRVITSFTVENPKLFWAADNKDPQQMLKELKTRISPPPMIQFLRNTTLINLSGEYQIYVKWWERETDL